MIKEIESLPDYKADTDVSIWEEELKKDYDTIKMAEQNSRLLETILDREGEVADLNARIESLDFKIHRMRDRLNKLATEDTPPEEFLQKKEFMEKDLVEKKGVRHGLGHITSVNAVIAKDCEKNHTL